MRKRKVRASVGASTSPRDGRPARPAPPATEAEIFTAFDQQIDGVWNRLEQECRQFADGFNEEMGSAQLQVRADTASLLVRFAVSEAEVMFQLDREQRFVMCWLNSGTTGVGNSVIEQPPVSMAMAAGRLCFTYAGAATSESALVVTLLTDMTIGSIEMTA